MHVRVLRDNLHFIFDELILFHSECIFHIKGNSDISSTHTGRANERNKKIYNQQVTFGIISGTRKKISNYSDEVGRAKGVRGQGPAKIKTALRRGDTPRPLYKCYLTAPLRAAPLRSELARANEFSICARFFSRIVSI